MLGCVLKPEAGVEDDRWILARLLARQEAKREDSIRQAWAHGSLVELYLLKWLGTEGEERQEAATRAREHAGQFVDRAPDGSFELLSTWRQVLRYSEFFKLIAGWADVSLAEEILEILPEPEN